MLAFFDGLLTPLCEISTGSGRVMKACASSPASGSAAIDAVPTPGRRRQSVDTSCNAGRRSSAPPANRVHSQSLDWPLSKEEKRRCALKLYERDVQAADQLLTERSQEVGELRKELREMRRLSAASTAPPLAEEEDEEEEEKGSPCASQQGSSCASQQDDAGEPSAVKAAGPERLAGDINRPAGPHGDCTENKGREELLLAAMLQYSNARRRSRGQEAVTQAPTEVHNLARLHSASESETVRVWQRVGKDHGLQTHEIVYWLSKSLPAPDNTEATERPSLWRQALLGSVNSPGDGLLESSQTRLASYLELRATAVASASAEVLQEEAESEVRAAWRRDTFLSEPGISDAVVSICVTVSSQRHRHVRGSAEVATLLLYALSPGTDIIAEAEADAFWCLSHLLTEVKGGLADDCHSGGGAGGAAAAAATTSRARRLQLLFREHDPTLCELLQSHGLVAMPAARLGASFCTAAGFSLASCARLWDFVLGDQLRFGFCDFAVVALLLSRRQELLNLKGDAAGMAEVLLDAPRTVGIDQILRFALALRALERRRRSTAQKAGGKAEEATEQRSQSQPPAKQEGPGVLHAIGSIWGRVRARGADALEVGRTAARCAFPQGQELPNNCRQSALEEDVQAQEMQPLRRKACS